MGYSNKPNINTGKDGSDMDLKDIRDFAPVMTISDPPTSSVVLNGR
jgi:hypothetical protein